MVEEGFGIPLSSSCQPIPTSEEAAAVFHIDPISMDSIRMDDTQLNDDDFVFIKQYRMLNNKLNVLLQCQNGYDLQGTTKTTTTMQDVVNHIKDLHTVTKMNITTLIAELEKQILDKT